MVASQAAYEKQQRALHLGGQAPQRRTARGSVHQQAQTGHHGQKSRSDLTQRPSGEDNDISRETTDISSDDIDVNVEENITEYTFANMDQSEKPNPSDVPEIKAAAAQQDLGAYCMPLATEPKAV